jgi:hypothetical protein
LFKYASNEKINAYILLIREKTNMSTRIVVKDRETGIEYRSIQQWKKACGINTSMSTLNKKQRDRLQFIEKHLGSTDGISPNIEWMLTPEGRKRHSWNASITGGKIHSNHFTTITHFGLRPKKFRCIETGVVYNSQREAARNLGYLKASGGRINQYLYGKCLSAYGHTWEQVGIWLGDFFLVDNIS